MCRRGPAPGPGGDPWSRHGDPDSQMSLPTISALAFAIMLDTIDAFNPNFAHSSKYFSPLTPVRKEWKTEYIHRSKGMTKPKSNSVLNIKNGPGDDRDDVDRQGSAKPFDKGASEFVPSDMQPANEWVLLKKEFLFDWPLLPDQVSFASISINLNSSDSSAGVFQEIGRSICLLFLRCQPSNSFHDIR